MHVKLNWHHSVELGGFPYNVDLDNVPAKSGIYIFLRAHGKNAEALYIGKASNLRSRIKQQLNNLKLMTGLKNSSNGTRKLVFAEWKPLPGQTGTTALGLAEKTLIRYYLGAGHAILNIQGAQLKYHVISSERPDLKSFLPISTKVLR